jgi:hypothetical protein
MMMIFVAESRDLISEEGSSLIEFGKRKEELPDKNEN